MQPFEVDRRTVAGENDLLAQTEQMVEDMEERSHCPLGCSPLLNIVHDQHIDGLVEIDEVVHRILTAGIGKLHLEQTCTDIQHPLLRIEFLYPYSDGIDEMRLSTARWSEDEHGVELGGGRILCDGHSHSPWQLVAAALDEVLESLLWVELGIDGLKLGGIEQAIGLVGLLSWLYLLDNVLRIV